MFFFLCVLAEWIASVVIIIFMHDEWSLANVVEFLSFLSKLNEYVGSVKPETNTQENILHGLMCYQRKHTDRHLITVWTCYFVFIQ